MYERFYNLRERPFSLSPDPDYLYLSRVHREALSHLQYGIEAQVGFIVISGEIGSGKTTLLQAALRGLDCQTSVSRIVNTLLDGRELIEAIMLDFGLDPGDRRSKPVLLHDLARFLVEQRTAGRLALLVVDEAQNLTLPALEEIRMLSNLETEKSKLIQIVLVGQPNLRAILARADLEQLRQRVTVTYHLPPIDADETAAYLQHRLQRASTGAPLEFPRDVAMLIHRYSEGIPRKINVIADAILLFGYSEDRRLIDVGLAKGAIKDLEETGVIAPAPSRATRSTPYLRQATVAPPVEQSNRDAALTAREARVAQQEHRLAEQQRVLLEQYRLVHGPTEPSPTSPAPAKSWPPAVASKAATPEPQETDAATLAAAVMSERRVTPATQNPVEASARRSTEPAARRQVRFTEPPRVMNASERALFDTAVAPVTLWGRLRALFGAADAAVED